MWDRAERQAAAVEGHRGRGQRAREGTVAVAPAAPTPPPSPRSRLSATKTRARPRSSRRLSAELTPPRPARGFAQASWRITALISMPAKDTWRHHQARIQTRGPHLLHALGEYADTREEDEMPRASCCRATTMSMLSIIEGLQDRGLRQRRRRASVSTVCAARARSTWSTVTRWPCSQRGPGTPGLRRRL